MKTRSPLQITVHLLTLVCLLLLAAHCSLLTVFAQSSTATLSGTVTDANGAVVPGVTVTVTDPAIRLQRTATTNDAGHFVVPVLPPSTYSVTLQHDGFMTAAIDDVVLNVNDVRSLNIQLKTGDVKETVNITGETPLINESPAVATTIDRQFVANIPLNGRSLQTLIVLSPGVVNTPQAANGGEPGQFSVNGQRTNANNFSVDGISGNFSAPFSVIVGQRGSGSTPAVDRQGAFSSLASVDAIQEFTIQTSTFAPEFGRSPGGQISIVTRRGENTFHGSLFEYFRNDALDANDFFNNKFGIKRQPLRYNNYGGSFSGPVILPRFGEGGPAIWKGTNKTFFFFSYEGQRFVLPQPTITTTVPSLSARQNASNEISRGLLNAFPLPNGAIVPDSAGNPVGAQYRTAFSDGSNADTYGVRLDHKFNDNFSLFGRINISDSSSTSRSTFNPSQYSDGNSTSKTLTLGANQLFGSRLVNELRANWSQQQAGDRTVFDGFGGGIEPSPALLLPSGVNSFIAVVLINPLMFFTTGNLLNIPQQNQQFQILDNLFYLQGAHQLRFGADHRLLMPKVIGNPETSVIFDSLQSIYNNSALLTFFRIQATYTNEVKTYGFYGQDTWKINKRATMTYGLRWEIDPAPSGRGDIKPLTLATPPDLTQLDQSSLQLAPAGTPYYETKFTNFAPRFGMSYLLSQKAGSELVVRGGIGLFYDLGQSGFGDVRFPFSRLIQTFFLPLPLTASNFNFPPPSLTLGPSNRANVIAAAADFTLPRTYQWNLTAQQSIGNNQALSLAYVGALGRKLVNARRINIALPGQFPNVYFSPNFSALMFLENGTESSYHSMQAQFTRRLSRGLQIIANYTWEHSIDTASNDTDIPAPGYIFDPALNRGDSDFDARHNFSGAVTYNIPTPNLGKIGNALFRNWSLNGVFTAHSGFPYTVAISEASPFGEIITYRRPDLTGQPIYLADPNVATGRTVNPAAFNFKVPSFQMGNLGRNSLRGENFWQVDLGLHRNIKVTEKVNLELRAEAFNLLNHPNFLYPNIRSASLSSDGTVTFNPDFGVITSSAARAYNGSFNTGFNPVFQSGGPRSLQFAFRLGF